MASRNTPGCVSCVSERIANHVDISTAHGQTHLHVIVGKGNHSPGHIQKIKPRVEQVCQELGLQYKTEANEGRIYIKLDGSPVQEHDSNNWAGYQHYPDYQQGGGNQYQQPQQPHYQQQQQQQYHQPQQQQQQHGQYDEAEKLARKFLPRILRKLMNIFCK